MSVVASAVRFRTAHRAPRARPVYPSATRVSVSPTTDETSVAFRSAPNSTSARRKLTPAFTRMNTSKQTASRVVLRSSFVGAQRKPVSRLPGARSNGTAVKTSASWNPFAQNSNKAGIVGSQGRDDYESEDVEYYFNYMGILADEGSNDRMDALLAADKHPIDVILLFAAAEGDVPKIEEILEAGADVNVTDLDGKTPLELAGKNNPEKKATVEAMLKAKM